MLINHNSIADTVVSKIKPFEYFDSYLKYGYYPYYVEGIDFYSYRLSETALMIFEQANLIHLLFRDTRGIFL